MRGALKFLGLLTTGLGALSLVGYVVLYRTTWRWFEFDVTQRSELAVTSARQSLIAAFNGDRSRIGPVLADIVRDDRILAAAACDADRDLVAKTQDYPIELDCQPILRRLAHEGKRLGADTSGLTMELANGDVLLSATELRDDGNRLGTVILVHDLTHLNRRATTTRNLSILAFFILSLGASLVTLVAMRLAWRNWIADFRQALAGRKKKEFQPLVRDVRALVEQLADERSAEGVTGPWSPERLRAVLTKHLHGERVIIAANREPYIHEKGPDGIRVLHPASGLVTALEPVMRACSGVWVAHGSGSADRETADRHDHVAVPPGEESYQIRRVWLTEAEEAGYYNGFANEGLWPLCHIAHHRPAFRAADFADYVTVNRRFADAVVSESDTDDPIVFVQDYHLALAPKMIREQLPKATILTFWHIPWPNAERVGICPWREELISGLLGSSIVGFHTRQHCNNFIDSVDAYMESRIDRENNAVVQGDRRTIVRPYPISIEWPVRWLRGIPSIAECRREFRERLGLNPEVRLGVGVDRLDYTKGIEERLQTVDDLLSRYPEFRNKFTFVQIAAPSRTKVAHYRELNARVESLVASINEKWSTLEIPPITLLRAHHEPPEIFRLFRAADVCYVSSLHDGMNLVAKEFVAARDDERGVLILSQFTGAARDLTEALLVNPYDINQAGDALAVALNMPEDEQRERMRSMRRWVSEFNVYRWAGKILVDAAEVRRRDRVADRLSAHHAIYRRMDL
jgi:trehalose 6-phosphate synthase